MAKKNKPKLSLTQINEYKVCQSGIEIYSFKDILPAEIFIEFYNDEGYDSNGDEVYEIAERKLVAETIEKLHNADHIV